jgi:hypothetical protein
MENSQVILKNQAIEKNLAILKKQTIQRAQTMEWPSATLKNQVISKILAI